MQNLKCQIMLLFYISFEKKVLLVIIYHCRVDVATIYMYPQESLYITEILLHAIFRRYLSNKTSDIKQD